MACKLIQQEWVLALFLVAHVLGIKYANVRASRVRKMSNDGLRYWLPMGGSIYTDRRERIGKET